MDIKPLPQSRIHFNENTIGAVLELIKTAGVPCGKNKDGSAYFEMKGNRLIISNGDLVCVAGENIEIKKPNSHSIPTQAGERGYKLVHTYKVDICYSDCDYMPFSPIVNLESLLQNAIEHERQEGALTIGDPSASADWVCVELLATRKATKRD